MYYVYVLLSEKDGKYYIGFTKDLKTRFAEHNKGHVKSTVERKPFKLIYYEASLNQEDAIRREKYLKSSWGKRYLKNRLRASLNLSNGARRR
jgi:putative endonuclease